MVSRGHLDMFTTSTKHTCASQQVMSSTSNEVLNRLVADNASWVVRVHVQKQDFKKTPIQISTHRPIRPTDMIDVKGIPLMKLHSFLAGGQTTQHQETITKQVTTAMIRLTLKFVLSSKSCCGIFQKSASKLDAGVGMEDSSAAIEVFCALQVIFVRREQEQNAAFRGAKHGRDMTEDPSNNMPARPMPRQLNISWDCHVVCQSGGNRNYIKLVCRFNILFAHFFAAMA